MSQEVPSAIALSRSNEKDRVRVRPGVVLAGAVAALVGAAWWQNRQGEAALRERTAKRLSTTTEAN
jgi:hypothetical protein